MRKYRSNVDELIATDNISQASYKNEINTIGFA
jgi:hypothetical protein